MHGKSRSRFCRALALFHELNLLITRYYAKIDAMMKDLERSIECAGLQPSESWGTVKGILGHLKPLILVADVEDFSGTITVPHQLRRLQEEFREYEEQTIRDRLNQFGMHLVDKTSIMAVVEDSRIELVRVPVSPPVYTDDSDRCGTADSI